MRSRLDVRQVRWASAGLHERRDLGGVGLRVAGGAVGDGYERGAEVREAGHGLLHGFERGVLLRGEHLEGD